MEEYILIECNLIPQPINLGFEIRKSEWEGMNEIQQSDFINKQYYDLLGEDNIELIESGSIEYSVID